MRIRATRNQMLLVLAGLSLGVLLLVTSRRDDRDGLSRSTGTATAEQERTGTPPARSAAARDGAAGHRRGRRGAGVATARDARTEAPEQKQHRAAGHAHDRAQDATPERHRTRPVLLGSISPDQALRQLAAHADRTRGQVVRRLPVAPRWRVGDRWRVYAYYRNMSAATPGDLWSGPVVWYYEVASRQVVQGRSAFVLTAYTRSGTSRTPGNKARPATFYVDAERYVPLAYRGWRLSRGELEPVYTLFDRDRVDAGGLFSLIPLDLPPAGTTGTQEPAGLPVLDAVTPALAEILPAPKRWAGAGGGYLLVKYTNTHDKTTVRQRWRPGDRRWPVTSITPSRRSYRLSGD